MSNRWIVAAAAIAGLVHATGCDDTPKTGTPLGEYVLSLFESRDTCDDDLNAVETTMALTQVEGQLRVELGGYPPLPAALDSQGVLTAQGVVEDGEAGTTVLHLEDVVFFQGGAVEGEGGLDFHGTFPDPDVTGDCVQQFTFSGEKTSGGGASALPTGP